MSLHSKTCTFWDTKWPHVHQPDVEGLSEARLGVESCRCEVLSSVRLGGVALQALQHFAHPCVLPRPGYHCQDLLLLISIIPDLRVTSEVKTGAFAYFTRARDK